MKFHPHYYNFIQFSVQVRILILILNQVTERRIFAVVTSAFSVDKVQVLITFTLVRATSVDALVKLVRAVEQVIIQTLVDICMANTLKIIN